MRLNRIGIIIFLFIFGLVPDVAHAQILPGQPGEVKTLTPTPIPTTTTTPRPTGNTTSTPTPTVQTQRGTPAPTGASTPVPSEITPTASLTQTPTSTPAAETITPTVNPTTKPKLTTVPAGDLATPTPTPPPAPLAQAVKKTVGSLINAPLSLLQRLNSGNYYPQTSLPERVTTALLSSGLASIGFGLYLLIQKKKKCLTSG